MFTKNMLWFEGNTFAIWLNIKLPIFNPFGPTQTAISHGLADYNINWHIKAQQRAFEISCINNAHAWKRTRGRIYNCGMVFFFFLLGQFPHVQPWECISFVSREKNATQVFNSGKLQAFLSVLASFYTIHKNSLLVNSHCGMLQSKRVPSCNVCWKKGDTRKI